MEAAVKSYRQALLIRPDFPEATCNLLHTLQVLSNLILLFQICDVFSLDFYGNC